MRPADALWSQEVKHHALSLSPEMHDYFSFLRKNGWFEDVVDMVLDQVMDFLTEEFEANVTSMNAAKLELVFNNPEGVANAIFRFVIDETLEKLGTDGAGPVHWATAAYFWFKWKDAHVARMMDVRNQLPEFIHG